MENNNEVFPQDILNEILLRMPVKSLGKFICVSKKWAAIIREKYFRDRYFLQSMTRPRLLFEFGQRDNPNVLFHSVYQEKEPLLSSGQQQTFITLEPYSEVCEVLRGLVCIKSAFKIVLCNPGTKKFLALPEIREGDREVVFIKTYLGYDEATDVFKVLSLTEKCVGNTLYYEYRVFTVGSGEDCWRTIVYEPEHTPFTDGLCKDGVLYYVAISKGNDAVIMINFNLGSEELNVIELPEQIKIRVLGISLVNYSGEIALVNKFVNKNGEIKIWVRNEVAGDWREETTVIPRWDLGLFFSFKGTIGTGELVFVQYGYGTGSMIVLYYDKITQHLRKFDIDGVASNTYHYAESFLDHVDSLLLM